MIEPGGEPSKPPDSPVVQHYRGVMRGCGFLVGLGALCLAAFLAFFASCVVVSLNDPSRKEFYTTGGLAAGVLSAGIVVVVGIFLMIRVARRGSR
jgi:hypothetical protein